MKHPLISLLLICFFYGCTSVPTTVNTMQPTKVQTVTPLVDIAIAYPVEATISTQPYPIDFPRFTQTIDIPTPSTPDEGHASISGKLIFGPTQKPQSNTRVVLVPAQKVDNVFRLPAIITSGFPELGDFIGFTDEQGNLQITNIEPGVYFLIVNFPDETIVGSKEGKAFLITLEKDQVLDLGVLSLE